MDRWGDSMPHSLTQYWQIFWLYRKMRLMKMMEYRTDFVFWSIVSIVWTVFNFFFFFVLTNLSDTIAGWTRAELFVLLSVFTILDAFVWSFFYRNMRLYTQSIFQGDLDIVLTKPISSQFVLSVQDNSYTNSFRLLIGIVGLIISVDQLPYAVSVWSWGLSLITIVISLILIYSLWFLIATIAFWIERLDNINEVFPALRDFYRAPRGVYSGIVSMIFTLVFPLMLITTVPSEILFGRAQPELIALHFISTVVFFFGSRKFYQYSLGRYASIGS